MGEQAAAVDGRVGCNVGGRLGVSGGGRAVCGGLRCASRRQRLVSKLRREESVISLLKDDSLFIRELFAKMRSSDVSMESKRELVSQFCSCMSFALLVRVYRLFNSCDYSGSQLPVPPCPPFTTEADRENKKGMAGLGKQQHWVVLRDHSMSQDRKIVSAGTDILILFLNQDPNLLRSYIVQQEGNSLLGLLVEGMVTDFGEEMHCQFLEILRILMDSFTMSGAHDEHLTRHVVKFNLLKPIIDAFVENGDRYNMLHSGVLELLEYIRKENLKSLIISMFVESFWDLLAKFEHFGSIQAFKLKYQQYLESVETRLSGSVPDTRKKAEERGLEKEEEDYFNEDSDEEDSGTGRRAKPTQNQHSKAKVANGSEGDDRSQSFEPPLSRSSSAGLVDYDDDDDEDFNPPPKEPDRTSMPHSHLAQVQRVMKPMVLWVSMAQILRSINIAQKTQKLHGKLEVEKDSFE
ncbi:hypothetical protein PR202_ga22947 [Eleusine coracana subsp. coracana]|uniref:Serine/threonine-protein phosphatase 4 regulatory subunit 3-like central domain-containing protein n=1 Tax=Eleusine coracana subsp. coracana TaxID=191504 RepID=A0AAV5D405_ELECO|nr:hypothetical protein PR202_ga22947 [Eleusine coracana subsp. coracana]